MVGVCQAKNVQINDKINVGGKSYKVINITTMEDGQIAILLYLNDYNISSTVLFTGPKEMNIDIKRKDNE